MAKQKFIEFQKANEYVVNKDRAVTSYIRYMLNRTQAMFVYSGLPETIPAPSLEYLLQTEGYTFITEVEGKLYALHGNLGGEPDVYGDFTQITVANTALKLSKTFDLKEDGVLMNSDTLRIGLLPILQKYGALLVENTLTMRTVDIMLRMSAFISASDDKTHTSAEKFIRDIENGKISAIGESAFFDGVKVQSVPSSQNYLTQFIDLEQYLKASCWIEIGLNGSYNMKREYIGNAESALNDDLLLPLVDNMIKERQTAIDQINKKYGTEISIDFASSWKVTHMENEKQVAIAEAVAEGGEIGDTGEHDRHSEVSVTSHTGYSTENVRVESNTGESGNEENTLSEPHNEQSFTETDDGVSEQDDTSGRTDEQEEQLNGESGTDESENDDEPEEDKPDSSDDDKETEK